MAEMKFTKLSSKGQVVIPRGIREILKLKPGTPFVVSEQGDMILLRKMEIPKIESKFIKKDLDIEKIKKKIIPILKKNNVTKAGIFGSYVTGEAKKDSDIDILIESPKGIGFGFAGIELELEKALGKKVDLLTYKGLSPYLKKYILKEEVRII